LILADDFILLYAILPTKDFKLIRSFNDQPQYYGQRGTYIVEFIHLGLPSTRLNVAYNSTEIDAMRHSIDHDYNRIADASIYTVYVKE